MADLRLPIYAERTATLGSSSGVAVREDAAYTNAKGKEKRGIRKRTEKAIAKLQDVLPRVLEREEAVFCAARAQLPVNAVEQFVLGWLAAVTDAGILVLTNHRLLFFLVARNGRWRRSVRNIRLGDIETWNVKTFMGPKLELKFRDGAKDHYWRLRRDDARRLKAMLATILPASSGDRSEAGTRVHLCPQCLAPLRAGNYRCPSCALAFKNEKVMTRRTWLFPGGGYFYSGHPGLAVFDFLIEALLLWEILYSAAMGVGLVKIPPSPGEPPIERAWTWLAAAVFVGILAGKKYLTARHCGRFIREFIAEK